MTPEEKASLLEQIKTCYQFLAVGIEKDDIDVHRYIAETLSACEEIIKE